jgi:hypothetical protein
MDAVDRGAWLAPGRMPLSFNCIPLLEVSRCVIYCDEPVGGWISSAETAGARRLAQCQISVQTLPVAAKTCPMSDRSCATGAALLTFRKKLACLSAGRTRRR